MDGSFCAVTAGECRSGAGGRVSKPTGMRNFRGLAAGLACLHSGYLKLCERALSFAVSRRKEGEVAWLESPNGLGTNRQNFNYAEKCQELNFLRFSAVRPHP